MLESTVTGSRNGHPFMLSLTDVDMSTSGLFAAVSINSTYAQTAPSDLSELRGG